MIFIENRKKILILCFSFYYYTKKKTGILYKSVSQLELEEEEVGKVGKIITETRGERDE